MNKINHKYLIFATGFLIIAWINVEIQLLDFVLGLSVFYCLSRYVMDALMHDEFFSSERKYLITRFHVFLLVHGVVFILLFIFIDYDFFRENGDWHEYDYYARAFSTTLSDEGINYTGGIAKASVYITFVGYIYYLFGGITALAVFANIFLIVTTSGILFLLVREIFDRRVAVRAMYLAALFPMHFVTEIHLVKEPLLYFLFLSACLLAYRATFNKHTISKVLLLVVVALIVYVRLIYIIPLIVYGTYYYTIIDFKPRHVVLVAFAIGSGIIYQSNIDQSSIQKHSVQASVFLDGVSMINEDTGDFNYQVNLSNPGQIVSVLLAHPNYYVKRIAKHYFLTVTGGTTVYRVPFLSYKSTQDARLWAFDVIRFLTGVMMWLFIFVTFSGLKGMITNHFQRSSIIWLSLATIPLINSMVGGNFRYQDTLTFLILICLAIGLENKSLTKWSMLAASIIGIGLIFFFAMGGLYSAKLMFFAFVLIGIHFLYVQLVKKPLFKP